MDILLTKKQLDAIEFFRLHNYVIVEAPRRSGKTIMLKELIKQYPERKIGVYCLNRYFFDKDYKHFKNCIYLSKNSNNNGLDMLIGDEYFLAPQEKPTACALSTRHIILRWKTSSVFAGHEELDNIKKEISEDHYQLEFGQYDQ